MITAGYVSRIPVPELAARCISRLSELGQEGFTKAKLGGQVRAIKQAIDATLKLELGLSSATNELLDRFDSDPIRLT